jgi:hypothetical protein
MADRAISELIAANQVTPTDLFVLEQSGTAKKLTGQILENWLVSFADGHGGIQSIAKKSTSGLVDTYRITLADTTTFDFYVTNGKSINTITKVSTSGLVDTYRITFNDGTNQTYTVTNGAKGDKGDNQYVWIKYASQKPTASSHSFGDVADNWIGVYSGESATAPTDWTQYEWFQIKGEKGDTGEPAKLTSSTVEYQVSDSGTITPSGAWSASVPVVAQGKYMWIRTTQTFNTGSPVVAYSVSRMGIDGSGSVSSVAGISPNSDGNVPLTASDVGAMSNTGGDFTGELRMNGQPISGLNAPTQNDQAANMGFVNQQMKKAAPRNLLDNSDFRNPVMQAGFDGLHGTVRYPIDRWYDRYGFSKFELTQNGIGISFGDNHAYFCQKIKDANRLIGKPVTIAMCTTEGDIFCASGIYVAEGTSILSSFGVSNKTFSVENGTVQICVTEGGLGLRWIALYEGEYTAETLPEYQPKGYGAELAECYRYYYKACNDTTLFYPTVCVGENAVYCVYSLPTQMRVKPTVSAKTMRVVSLPGYSVQEGFTFEVATDGGNQLCIGAIKTAHGLEQCMFEFNQIEFSADL